MFVSSTELKESLMNKRAPPKGPAFERNRVESFQDILVRPGRQKNFAVCETDSFLGMCTDVIELDRTWHVNFGHVRTCPNSSNCPKCSKAVWVKKSIINHPVPLYAGLGCSQSRARSAGVEKKVTNLIESAPYTITTDDVACSRYTYITGWLPSNQQLFHLPCSL